MCIRDSRLLCASMDALMLRMASPDLFKASILRLAPGDRFGPDKLIRALVRMGYERVEMVEGKGQCALRGSIAVSYTHLEKLGYTRSFTIYDDDDQGTVIKEILKRLNIDEKFLPPREVKAKISDAKNKLMGPDEWFAKTEREDVYKRQPSSPVARVNVPPFSVKSPLLCRASSAESMAKVPC